MRVMEDHTSHDRPWGASAVLRLARCSGPRGEMTSAAALRPLGWAFPLIAVARESLREEWEGQFRWWDTAVARGEEGHSRVAGGPTFTAVVVLTLAAMALVDAHPRALLSIVGCVVLGIACVMSPASRPPAGGLEPSRTATILSSGLVQSEQTSIDSRLAPMYGLG